MALADWVQTKGFGTGIGLGELGVNRRLQIGDGAEDATADALPDNLTKKAS